MGERINYWEYEEGGKELKVPHRANAAAACDSNMPHMTANCLIIKAMCLIQWTFAFIPNTSNSSFVVAI
jgi:hypothetical protein